MTLTTTDRRQALRMLFTDAQAKLLAEMTWKAIHQGLLAPRRDSPFGAWSLDDREHLVALLLLLADFRENPPSGTCPPAIAAAFRVRVRQLKVRTVWVVCVSSDMHVEEEVLACMGGDVSSPPPLKTLLRLVLIRALSHFVVIDFRPMTEAHVDQATIHAFDRLRTLADTAGLVVHDWFVMGWESTESSKDALVRHAAREPEIIDVEAA